MTPRVALLASTYASAPFLPAWLASLEAQSVWPEIELAVVANGPDDEERRLLDAFAARHPRQVRLIEVEREPLYASWNRAIAATTAPVLAIANVDDLRTPGGLERQLHALDSDPGALFSYGGFAIATDFPPGPPCEEVTAMPFDREAFTRGMLLGPFFAWRRAGAGKTWFDEQLRVAGDMDLAVRLALHGRGVPVEGSLGSYYDNGTGLSTSGTVQRVEGLVLYLRYGVYDKVDVHVLPEAARYVIPRLRFPGGEWVDVADAVPGYDALLAARRATYRPPRRLRDRIGMLRG